MLLADTKVPTEPYTHPTTSAGFGGINTDTVRNTAICCGILVLVAVVIRLRMDPRRPGWLQNLLEWFVDSIRGLVGQTLGDRPIRIAPIAITLFAFVLVANLLGLVPGLKSPTNDVNTAMALGLFIVILLHAQSIRFRGLGGYVAHYFGFAVTPRWTAAFGLGALVRILFAFIEVVIEIAKPFTLAFRLYFNIFVGELMLAIILALLGAVGAVVGGAWIAFSIFVGIIQAFIITMLMLAYVAQGTETHTDEHGEEHVDLTGRPPVAGQI